MDAGRIGGYSGAFDAEGDGVASAACDVLDLGVPTLVAVGEEAGGELMGDVGLWAASRRILFRKPRLTTSVIRSK